MISNFNNMRSGLRASAALQALALLGAGLTAGGLAAAPAAAQDFTTGALVGSVTDASGARVTEGTVTVRSNAQGFTRTVSINSDGSFRVQTLPTGQYTVTVTAGGNPPLTDQVSINPGANNTYTFTVGGSVGTATTETGDDIVVTGSVQRGNDFGSNTGGLNIGDVSQLLNNTPIARNQTALIALSPGVSLGDTAFGNLPSIGGATVAENAYYVNGLNVTNFRNFVGANNPPIEFYRSIDVKSFGLSAEFGRALGGFTTVVTKSGSNDWEAGAVIAYSPDALRDDSPNTYAAFNQNDYSEDVEANFYLSGPIIKDRLFFYALYNPNYTRTQDSSITGGNRLTTVNSSPFFGGKLDFIIADGHRLEGTYFRNKQTFRTNYDAFNGTTQAIGAPQGTLIEKQGGDNFVVTYTGQFTDWLSLSGAYGENHDERVQQPAPIRAFAQSFLTGTTTTASGFNSANNRDDDTRKFYRADADVYVNLLGSHHFRAGYEREELTSVTDTRYAGDYRYEIGVVAATTTAPRFPFIDRYFYENIGTFKSLNESFYIQDSWSLLDDRLTLQLGIRNDKFSNDALDGTTYFKSGDQWGPRLGASFDVFGDKRTSIRGTWSRYFLPVATNTNIRLGGAELYYRQRFAFPAGASPDVRDANGLPAGLTIGADGNITSLGALTGSRVCPAGGPNAGQACFSITSDGVQGPTDTLVSSSLAPSYTDEWSVGVQHRIGDWDFSLTYLNRRLGRTLDDVAIDAAVLKYCAANGIAGCDDVWSGFHQYVLANPGDDITVRLDGDCAVSARQCEVATLTANDLGFPAASRNYDSVQFQFNKPFRDGWQVGGSYVWTRLRGNYEGAVKSDIGQDDAGLTQDFDQPGLLDNSYGPLANGREHAFKLFGAVKLFEGVRFGANLFFESPRKFSCYGYHPTDAFAAIYGEASYYCRQPQFSSNGGVTTNLPLFGDPDYFGLNGQVRYPVQRGSAFQSNWRKQIDVNLGYDIAALPGSFVSIDVFNVFNFKSKIDYNEFGENADGEINSRFGQPIGYQAPRAVRFTLGLRFGGGSASRGGDSNTN
ncbi:Carboxypeptidase regulatory-like domain-containing protein [Sphingomonas guangdongensis]|uniref:Carboxypeptidase regulatory-like domain-containing protein n=1 Tax=Sphingomonas guangdongensis TaxID=1141890 RepID=A0A285QHR1_9SPHN|nr:TonB-dependent receptor [Sphingomonas guangdongensis]SOB81048.1 Carboxypeptidase regulatory-like domain-containing protein [Sphingomonas guangdongensis]